MIKTSEVGRTGPQSWGMRLISSKNRNLHHQDERTTTRFLNPLIAKVLSSSQPIPPAPTTSTLASPIWDMGREQCASDTNF